MAYPLHWDALAVSTLNAVLECALLSKLSKPDQCLSDKNKKFAWPVFHWLEYTTLLCFEVIEHRVSGVNVQQSEALDFSLKMFRVRQMFYATYFLFNFDFSKTQLVLLQCRMSKFECQLSNNFDVLIKNSGNSKSLHDENFARFALH